jgi:hypothetical protein
MTSSSGSGSYVRQVTSRISAVRLSVSMWPAYRAVVTGKVVMHEASAVGTVRR